IFYCIVDIFCRFFFFFFQAEDGIRDGHVTGVQTCALPIYTGGRFTVFEQTTPAGWGPPRHVHANEDEIVYVLDGTYDVSVGNERSEERRVGKECRSRWWRWE